MITFMIKTSLHYYSFMASLNITYPVSRIEQKYFQMFAIDHLNLVMRKPAVCTCENKDADQ